MSTSNFGERLKQLRREKNLTQEQLAEVFGVARNSIFSYETGRRIPDIEVLKSYAEYFGVTSDYLLGLSDNRTNETAAIGDKLGLSDETIASLIEYNEKAKNDSTKNNFYHKRLLDTVNIIINEHFLLDALKSYIFQELNQFIDFAGWCGSLDDIGMEDDEEIEVDEFGIPKNICEEMMNCENDKYIDKDYVDSYEASQAMNMYEVQYKLKTVSEKVVKQGVHYYAKENKRQE